MPPDSRFVPLEVKPDTTPIMIKHFTSSLSKFLSVVTLFFLISFTGQSQSIPEDAASISAGQTLFNGNCKSCHKVHQQSVGPALKNVYERAPSIDWIKGWIRNSAKVVASGDEYGVKIFEEYKKSQMTAFTNFSDEQIMNILAYIQAETKKGDTPVGPDPGTKPTGAETGGGLPANYLNVILIGMVLILVLLVIILGFLISSLKRFLDQKNLSEEDREVVHSPITASTISRSRGFIFIVTFLVAALGFKAVINGLYSVGIQQGYAPKQPIAFSHKLHAGDKGIPCQYCHSSARRPASVPM